MLDAYELLGLRPGATEPEVKRAFRRLAMRWHPDRNPDPAATERFKALRQAYDRLLAAADDATAVGEDAAAAPADESAPADATATDPHTDSRRAGAHGGRRSDPGRGPSSTADSGNDADDDAPLRGADRRLDLELSFEEAFLGGRKALSVPTAAVCAHCNGSGTETLSVSRLCEPCRGSGRLREGGGLARCSACHGRGYRSTRACSSCHGSGRQTQARALRIELPPGLIDDDELRLAGEGEPAPVAGGRAGDLRVRIRLAAHALFRRDGRDLVLRRPLSALRMLLGGELRIAHPAGARTLLLEPGPAEPRRLRVAGAGFPARGRRRAGDLVVELVPTWPQSPDAALRGLIEQLEAEVARKAARHLPEVAQWEARWLG